MVWRGLWQRNRALKEPDIQSGEPSEGTAYVSEAQVMQLFRGCGCSCGSTACTFGYDALHLKRGRLDVEGVLQFAYGVVSRV